MPPTLEGIPSDKEAVEGDSAAKRHKSTSRSRSILPQSLYSIADMDAAELVALDLNKPKVWQVAGVPQLTAADDNLDSSTHDVPQSTGTLLPGASSVAMIQERAVLRNPSKAQSKELNKLHMNLTESVVIPKVSDNTNVYRDLADKTVSGRVVTPSRKSLEQFGYNYGK